MARLAISTTRINLDARIQEFGDVCFFISSITAVSNNRIIYPAVSYFIVYRETAACNNAILIEALHTNDFDVRPIRSRPRGGEQNIEQVLFAAVKYHNNTAVKTMVANSNAAAVHDRHMPEHPIRLVVVDQQFENALVRARNNLHQVGFNSELLGLVVPPQEVPVPAPEVQPAPAVKINICCLFSLLFQVKKKVCVKLSFCSGVLTFTFANVCFLFIFYKGCV